MTISSLVTMNDLSMNMNAPAYCSGSNSLSLNTFGTHTDTYTIGIGLY